MRCVAQKLFYPSPQTRVDNTDLGEQRPGEEADDTCDLPRSLVIAIALKYDYDSHHVKLESLSR